MLRVCVCSTLVGDIAEVKAIKKVFSDTKHLKMNATKSLIGHCLGAAAGIEAVAVVKAIQTGWLHPTLNQDNLVEEVAGIDTVPNEKKQHKVRVHGVAGIYVHLAVYRAVPFYMRGFACVSETFGLEKELDSAECQFNLTALTPSHNMQGLCFRN